MICDLCSGSPLEEFLRMASEVFVGEGEISSATSHTDVIDILVNFTKFGTLN